MRQLCQSQPVEGLLTAGDTVSLTSGPTWLSFLVIQAAAVVASVLGSSVIAAFVNSRAAASTASDTRMRDQLALVHDSLDDLRDAYAKRRQQSVDDDTLDAARRRFVAACARCLDDGITDAGRRYVIVGDLFAAGAKSPGFAQEAEAHEDLSSALRLAGKRYSGDRRLERESRRGH